MHCVTEASCRRILGLRLWRCVEFQERHAVERRRTGKVVTDDCKALVEIASDQGDDE